MNQELIKDGLIVSKTNPLTHNVEIGPSKHAANALCGAFPLADTVLIKNPPETLDFLRFMNIFESLGSKILYDNTGSLSIQNRELVRSQPDKENVQKVRASILLLSATLLRTGHISMPLPEGDWPGSRPTSSTLSVAEQFGVEINQNGQSISATLKKSEKKKRVINVNNKVFATLAAMILATGIGGETTIENPLSSLEVDSLERFLIQLGAEITSIDDSNIKITSGGMNNLRNKIETVIPPDACETMFWIAYAKLHQMELSLDFPYWSERVTPKKFGPLYDMSGFMRHTHAIISGKGIRGIINKQDIRQLEPADIVFFDDKKGMPRDAAPALAVLFCALDAISTYDDDKYGIRRVEWMKELRKVGAKVEYYYQENPARATIHGNKMYGYKPVHNNVVLNGTDIRSAASLALAASTCETPVGVTGLSHILRSYTKLPEKMSQVGTKLHYISSQQ